MKRLSFTIYFAFILVSMMNAQSVTKGILDLRKSRLNENSVLDLSGEWQFHYGKHLTASEMAKIPFNSKHYLKVPSSWATILYDGKKLPFYGIGTYSLNIILNTEQKKYTSNYAFYTGYVVTAYKLWVNNELISQVGNATTKPKGFIPMYLPQPSFFYCKGDTIKIVVHISNFFDPIFTGFLQKTYLGTRESILHKEWLTTAFTLFIFSILLLLFIYQLIIGIVEKENKSHFPIAFIALLAISKMFCDGPISIYNFIPSLHFIIFYRVWFFSFFIIYFIFRLAETNYPSEVNKTVSKYINWFYILSAISFLFLDVVTLVYYSTYVAYANFICVIYLFYVFTKAIIRDREFSIISFISFVIMVGFIINDFMYLVYHNTAGYFTHVGVAIYISIQSVTISLKYARSHKRVVEMSNEILEINRGLENIVKERTQALENIGKQKDLLISTISHDLMGFFNTMLNLSKVLSCDKTLDGEQKETLHRLYQTSHRGYYLLDNILAWAKLQIKFNPEKELITDLKSLVDRNIELFSEQITCKTISTIVHIDNTLQFKCSNENLNSILRNLISNAIKFSNTGGEIHISNQVKDGLIQIRIHDSGIGISNELMTHLFTHELSMKREGTLGERGSGLGLLIVKELVEGNSGKIFCNSEINKGTCFIVEFTADIAVV